MVYSNKIVKNRLRLFNSPALNHEELGLSFCYISFIIVLWISYKKILLTIMKKLNKPFILEKLRWKILTRWWTVMILLLVVPCTHALLAEILNLSLSAVPVIFASLAETNIPWNALPVCPLNWFMFNIVTVFSPSMKTFGISFSKTALCLTAFDFIKRFIWYIPEKHFKMIRYGGFYVRLWKIDFRLRLVRPKSNFPIK